MAACFAVAILWCDNDSISISVSYRQSLLQDACDRQACAPRTLECHPPSHGQKVETLVESTVKGLRPYEKSSTPYECVNREMIHTRPHAYIATLIRPRIQMSHGLQGI